jgi:protein ImuA
MARARPPTAIAELRRVLERAKATSGARGVLTFGGAAIDDHLPGGGVLRGVLHELIDGGSAATYAAGARSLRAQSPHRHPREA